MRVIKFRAWDKESKRLLNGFALDSSGNILFTKKRGADGKYRFCNLSDQGYPNERFDLMQFTGLLDKHGKECFEGDIIDHNGEVFEVVWDAEGVWMAKGVSSRLDPHTGDDYQISDVMLCDRIKVAEIVGNIYEG